jgi:fatty acid desaturase
MKRVVKSICEAFASVWAEIVSLARRFDWEEARSVSVETATNAAFAILFYVLALCALVGVIFFGAVWQLLMVALCYVAGAVLMQDRQWGNETACHYIERCFSKKVSK